MYRHHIPAFSLFFRSKMSSFGKVFRIHTFGESHCKGVGVIIDNCPPGLALSEADVQPQLTRRRPGQSELTTPRNESDTVTIYSGVEKGVTLGTPIMMMIPNKVPIYFYISG
jgi:chorismate synthase